MGIFDKLKKTKTDAPAAQPETVLEKAENPKTEQPAEILKTDTGSAYQVLLHPVLTEKATRLASAGKYVFAVSPRANKSEIRKNVQKVYDVHVTEVKIINLHSKKRRYGKSSGSTSVRRKAIVYLREGEKIAGFIESVG